MTRLHSVRLRKVRLNDPDVDAKLFPHLHPYGTGSLHGTEGDGALIKYATDRLLSLSPAWRNYFPFIAWLLDRHIKSQLYHAELNRQHSKRGVKRKPDDSIEMAQAMSRGALEDHRSDENLIFGHTDPASIPESGARWRQRQNKLLAISEPHEHCVFAGMMTITQNDSSPELLAHARRGPCATPTAEEMIEHLFVLRGSKHDSSPNMTSHPEAATLSYQKRTRAIQRTFPTTGPRALGPAHHNSSTTGPRALGPAHHNSSTTGPRALGPAHHHEFKHS